MEIPFRGQYDRPLFFKAVRLANSPAGGRRIVQILILAVLIAVSISAGLVLIETGEIARIWMHLAVVFIMGYSVAQSIFLPYLAARKMWDNPSVQRPLSGTVTKKGITYTLPGMNNEIGWERFNRVRKTAGLVTLVTGDGLLVVFPHSFFRNARDWEHFVEMVNTRVVPTR